MECEEVVIRLWEYLDEELTPEEVEAVAAHLSRCGRCHPRCCRDRAFLALLARQRFGHSAPPLLQASILARLRIH